MEQALDNKLGLLLELRWEWCRLVSYAPNLEELFDYRTWQKKTLLKLATKLEPHCILHIGLLVLIPLNIRASLAARVIC